MDLLTIEVGVGPDEIRRRNYLAGGGPFENLETASTLVFDYYGAGGWEHAVVRFLPTGRVEVVSGATPHGQGHETSWSMIVAGIDPADVTVLHSDTAISPLNAVCDALGPLGVKDIEMPASPARVWQVIQDAKN